MDEIALLRSQFETAIQDLRQQIQQQRPQRPKPSLPDPEKFTGQSLKFDTWLPSIKAKLRIDSLAIGDPVAQFYYVYLNLDSSVQAMVLPQLHYAEETQSWDYTSILNQLERVYANPNKIHDHLSQHLALPTEYPAFIRVVQQLSVLSYLILSFIQYELRGRRSFIRGVMSR